MAITYGTHSYVDGAIEFVFPEQADCIIGKFCSIARNVKIFLGGNHRTDWLSTYPFVTLNTGHPTTKGNVVIGNDVWIGREVSIMTGVTIGDGAVIAASSVVAKNVRPYTINAGNPCEWKRNRFPPQCTKALMKLQWWDWPLENIQEAAVFLQGENWYKLTEYAKAKGLMC